MKSSQGSVARWRWFVLIGMAALAAAVVKQGAAVRAQQPGTRLPEVSWAIKSDVSPPLSSLPPSPQGAIETVREIPLYPVRKGLGVMRPGPAAPGGDPARQTTLPTGLMPDPLQNFEGVGNRNGVLPPDTDGDVGLTHYVQWVNLSFAVYDKAGNLLLGPLDGNTLWSDFGTDCETHNNGDIMVKYDRLADRWLMSQFAYRSAGPFFQCIAISQTGDPTGAFYRYAFKISDTKLNDYAKFGVWPDAYYMSINQFMGSMWGGQGVVAFERDKMLMGDPDARMVKFDLLATDPNLGAMLPSDFDGPPPPDGSPNPFIEVDFPESYPTTTDILQVFQFHVDWTDPDNSSTFTGPLVLETDPFDANLCGFRNCVPQPETSQLLEALSDRLMYRLQYRNFGDHESLVMNHTVNAGANRAGIRWYELRKDVGDWAIFQQGTYAPDDGLHRWMGSIAQDGAGNMALGYSVSSSSTFPSIRYVGRMAGDPPGDMTQAEATLIDGGGVQLHSSGRWGDYSNMAVDPTDDCTFWYTQEYYAVTSVASWQTRIGSFQFPGCGTPPGAAGSSKRLRSRQ
jgi:hypothetical protein